MSRPELLRLKRRAAACAATRLVLLVSLTATAFSQNNPPSPRYLLVHDAKITKDKSGVIFEPQLSGQGAKTIDPEKAGDLPSRQLLERLLADPNFTGNSMALGWNTAEVYVIGAVSVAMATALYPSILKDTANYPALKEYNTAYQQLLLLPRDEPTRVESAVAKFVATQAKAIQSIANLIHGAALGKSAPRLRGLSDVLRRILVEGEEVASVGTRAPQPKSASEFYDVFKRDAYEKMLQNLALTGAILSGPQAIGSGVFVGPELFLTCKHVVGHRRDVRLELKHHRAVYHYSYVQTVFDATRDELKDSDTYSDLALLQVKLDPRQGKPDLPKLAFFSRDEDHLERPIYVLARHRSEPALDGVYDSGRIFFPHEVRGKFKMPELFAYALVGAQAKYGFNQELVLSLAGRLLREMRESYRYNDEGGNADTVYRYRKPTWDSLSNPSPFFGFTSSTPRGSSGGGVFDKESGELVGIMAGGSTDQLNRLSWRNHEFGIPVSAVRAVLREYKSSKGALQLTVEGL